MIAGAARAARVSELFALAPLYAILDTGLAPDPLPVLEALLRAGVRVVQYRHKQAFGAKQFEECREASRQVRRESGLFLVNDRADIAALCGADGVHLGQEDLPPGKARALLGDAAVIGYSTHNREQASLAAGEPVDYIAIGPVFATTTKKNPDPVIDLPVISEARRLAGRPVVAIGGITVENAPAVVAAGANAVAVASRLLLATDVELRAREFLAALRSLRSA